MILPCIFRDNEPGVRGGMEHERRKAGRSTVGIGTMERAIGCRLKLSRLYHIFQTVDVEPVPDGVEDPNGLPALEEFL